jgi:hypothetical protein
MRRLTLPILLAAALGAGALDAKTLRWASQGDILTFDPMGQNESLNNTFNDYVYEGLVRYNKQFVPEPALATSWTKLDATTWRFVLRRNVRFHDGTPMTADDVVFSFERILKPASNMKIYAQGVKEVRKVDDYTVDMILDGPNPVLLRQLVDAKIMSKAWSVKNNVVNPQNYARRRRTTRCATPTAPGPFMLKSREPDVRTVLVANPNYWDRLDGNLTEIVYTPIKSDATRTAALSTGEVDLVLDPPTQDVPRLRQNAQVKIADGTETRIIFLGFDQWRDETPYANVKGKNPFKDRRVRQALYQAIDIEAIKRATMRGLARADRLDDRARGQRLHRGHRQAAALRSQRGEAPARRGRLREPRVHARLPEQPLHQRRGDLPGDRRDVGARGRQGAAQRDAAGDLLPEGPEVRHLRLPARLGDGDVRRAVHASEPRALGRPQGRRRRQLQPRQVRQSEGRRADRQGQGRGRRREAQRDDARGAACCTTPTSGTSRCTSRSSRGRCARTCRCSTAPTTASTRAGSGSTELLAFVLRRVLQTVAVLLTVALIAFALFNYTGDPIAFMLPQDATLAERQQMRPRARPRPAVLRAVRALRRERGARRVRRLAAPGPQGVDAAARAAARDARAVDRRRADRAGRRASRPASTRRCDATARSRTCCSPRRWSA